MLQLFLRFAWYSLVIILSMSCKRDPANLSNPGGTAHYSFDGTPGACSSPLVAGKFEAGTALTSANTVTFTVNVTVVGSYSMKSTAVNGVYFSGAGVFTSTGPQIVVLTGSGTPLREGNFPFVPATGNTCNFFISFRPGPPVAVFTFIGSSGNCSNPVVNGTYYSGVTLLAGNYVELKVNVITAGVYTINTNSTNGIGFSGSGIFTAPGAQVVRLSGNGTPIATGNFSFTPGVNGCSFNITVTPLIPPATFTYNGAPGNCTGPVINGTYAAGIALNGSNTVILSVNVSAIGTYTVSTNSANSVVFSGSGTFTTTGANTITLTSSNTPMAAGTFNYRPAGGCSFDIVYSVAPPPSVNFLNCFINGVATNFNDFMLGISKQSGSPYTFHVEGFKTGGSDKFVIDLVDIDNPIAFGDYNNVSSSNFRKNCQISYRTGSGQWSVSLLNPNSFVVHIISITATNATGNFSGTLFDNTGSITNVKSIIGSFSISY